METPLVTLFGLYSHYTFTFVVCAPVCKTLLTDIMKDSGLVTSHIQFYLVQTKGRFLLSVEGQRGFGCFEVWSSVNFPHF